MPKAVAEMLQALAEAKLEIEQHIVVRMPPIRSRQTTVAARYMGPAVPRVVFDPPPEGVALCAGEHRALPRTPFGGT